MSNPRLESLKKDVFELRESLTAFQNQQTHLETSHEEAEKELSEASRAMASLEPDYKELLIFAPDSNEEKAAYSALSSARERTERARTRLEALSDLLAGRFNRNNTEASRLSSQLTHQTRLLWDAVAEEEFSHLPSAAIDVLKASAVAAGLDLVAYSREALSRIPLSDNERKEIRDGLKKKYAITI